MTSHTIILCSENAWIGCFTVSSVFKKYWFEGHCWNFLQTPWLWNTKECWYNYPYQVKPFNSLLLTIFQSCDVENWLALIGNINFIILFLVLTQPLTVDIHYYYVLELSFYLSLLFSQFTDIRRKVRPQFKWYHIVSLCSVVKTGSVFSMLASSLQPVISIWNIPMWLNVYIWLSFFNCSLYKLF